jgi:hypothetical protein
MMRVIIAGSRGIEDPAVLDAAVAASKFEITEVITSNSRGIDQLAAAWAKRQGVPLVIVPAQWNAYGGRAGHIRDERMADGADALLAVWDGFSRGTAHMIAVAKARGLPMHVHRVEPKR